MINEEMISYIKSLNRVKSALILEMEELAHNENVPIMDELSLNTMISILQAQQPKRILEVGTAIGYSAIRLAEALPSTTIITIERDEHRYEQAVAHIERAGLSDRIIPYLADAADAVHLLKPYVPFDSIFIDAAKGKYQTFFQQFEPLLADNGVILSDNILFRGLVAKQDLSMEPKRIQKLVEKIKHYNEWLCQHTGFYTSIIPIGDGIACSTRIKREDYDNKSK
ncbi:O-methyltransferase [Shouchella miscanthi]|uniref:tRNA 5-hydroxyuridine methyltransferase n=1 Tax=Shouchella miscanthi TaxID=2598861 RepID=A0ABU6NPH3_9BACI|nr:O-methyltransferase [Shouchella miscanthi]MED4130098.1 O-methyltransferase [Shouchella miscanthi]